MRFDGSRRRNGRHSRRHLDVDLTVRGRVAEAGVCGVRARHYSRAELLELARGFAEFHARRHPLRICSADDVYGLMLACGLCPADLGAAAGSIFKGKAWSLTPYRVKSLRASNRAREIKVWRFVGERCEEERACRACHQRKRRARRRNPRRRQWTDGDIEAALWAWGTQLREECDDWKYLRFAREKK